MRLKVLGCELLYVRDFGEDNARYLMETLGTWGQNYNRLADLSSRRCVLRLATTVSIRANEKGECASR